MRSSKRWHRADTAAAPASQSSWSEAEARSARPPASGAGASDFGGGDLRLRLMLGSSSLRPRTKHGCPNVHRLASSLRKRYWLSWRMKDVKLLCLYQRGMTSFSSAASAHAASEHNSSEAWEASRRALSCTVNAFTRPAGAPDTCTLTFVFHAIA